MKDVFLNKISAYTYCNLIILKLYNPHLMYSYHLGGIILKATCNHLNDIITQ